MKKLLCGLMLVAMVVAAAPAMAFDFDDHVTLAPNGRGDLLIYPVYVALDGGWETKLQVTNTSRVYSTVAKVVIRSFVYSKELLDFFIYLSPTDVWTGKIVFGAGGPTLFSDDDSILVGAPATFASPANPVNQVISTPVCPDDSKVFGYIEVFEAWSTSLGPKPVPKFSSTAPLNSVKGAFDAATTFVTRNILAGHFEIVNETIAVSGVHDATVLKDYQVNARLTLGVETFIGQNARNSLCEVEAALSKTSIGLYYYDNALRYALPMVTLPTKLVNNALCNCADGVSGTSVSVRGPFFNDNTSEDPYCYGYVAQLFVSDLLESVGDSPLFSPAPIGPAELIAEELHFIIHDYLYEEGWLELVSDDTGTFCTPQIGVPDEIFYSGIPLIATNLFLGGDGLALLGGNWNFGDVFYSVDSFSETDLFVPDYQLSDSTVRFIDF